MRKKLALSGVGLLIFAALLIFGRVANGNAEEGLAGYWKFDEGQGAVAKDSSGKGNDGKIIGAVYVKEGNGFALEFDGKGSSVDCGKSVFDFTGKGSFTVCAWFKTDDTAENNHRCIVSKGGATYIADRKGWFLGKTRGGLKGQENVLIFRIMDGTEFKPGHYITLVGSAVADNAWHFTAVTVDCDSGTINVYLDGKMIKTMATLPEMDKTANDYPLLIGNDAAENMFWKGLIDEVKIYSRDLSEDEIKAQYTQSLKK